METNLNIGSNAGRDNQMEIGETPVSSLFPFKPIKLSAMDTFLDAVVGNHYGESDKVFQSFEISNNTHEVGVDLMKHIASFARNVFDLMKPIFLYDLRFSNVTSKTEWMNRM